MIFKNAILFGIFFILYSCNSQNNKLEKKMVVCVNKSISKNASDIYGEIEIDFYNLMGEVEKILINEKFIKSPDQNNYRKLLKQITSNSIEVESIYKKINLFLESNKFDYNDFINISIVFRKCINKAIVNKANHEDSTFSKQSRIFSHLEIQGFNDYSILDKLIFETKKDDFDKIVYRSPIILLTIINMGYQVNGIPKKIKF